MPIHRTRRTQTPQPARNRAKTRFSQRSFILAAIVLVAAAIGAYYGADIWRAAPVRSSDMPRIAVLPFDDMSTGADKGYLSDAVAEGIITELARSKTYAVIARNSSFRYRDQPIDARQIGDELGVDYLLEGSQQKIGDRLKVTAQLLNAHDGSHLWANTYNREIGDLFVVQEEIIRTLADRVGRRITRPWPQSGAARVSALRYYLMGFAVIQKDFSAAGTELQRQFSLKAIEADPNSQFGYIGLAHTYQRDAAFGWHQQEHSRDEALKRAAEYADKAILLAPDDANAHCARARIHTEAGEIEQAIARYRSGDRPESQQLGNPRRQCGTADLMSAVQTKRSIGSSRLWASILSTLTGSTGRWAGRSTKRTIAGLRWRRCGKCPESRTAHTGRLPGSTLVWETSGRQRKRLRFSSKTRPATPSANNASNGRRVTPPPEPSNAGSTTCGSRACRSDGRPYATRQQSLMMFDR